MKAFIPIMALLVACQSPNSLAEWKSEQSYAKGQVAIIDLPDTLDLTTAFLEDADQNFSIPVQRLAQQVCFLPTHDIAAGSPLRLVAKPEEQVQSGVAIRNTGDFLQVKIGDQEVAKYWIAMQMPPDTLPEYYKRNGFIHPLRTRSGTTITDGFPRGHTHQHGLFNAWTRTHFRDTFIDFWNQHSRLGTVVHVDVLDITHGPVYSSFSVSLQQVAYLGTDTVPALDETWEMRFFPLEEDYFVDWLITQRCHTEDPLILDEYHYGGAAFRGHDQWNVESGAYDSLVYFLTNEGKTHTDGNHSRPLWADMSGQVGSATAGITMMGHPSNFRHPQPVRVHPTMPYFVFAPEVLGEFSIQPGAVYQSRYGLLVHDGRAPQQTIERLHRAYAAP